MPQRIRFPAATTAWSEYLEPRAGVPAGGGHRTDTLDFVRIVRTGGTRQTKVTDNAQMTFECYGENADKAEALAADVESLVFAAAGRLLTEEPSVRCKRVTSVSGPSWQPDPDRPDQARYVVTALTALRGAIVSEEGTAP